MTGKPQLNGDGRQFDPLNGAWWLTGFFTVWIWVDDWRQGWR
jgi:hypothetical protein